MTGRFEHQNSQIGVQTVQIGNLSTKTGISVSKPAKRQDYGENKSASREGKRFECSDKTFSDVLRGVRHDGHHGLRDGLRHVRLRGGRQHRVLQS